MRIETLCEDFAKLHASNVTASPITAPSPTTTMPSGDGVIRMRGDVPANQVALVFFGAGSDDATATALVIGWRKVGTLWVPTKLLALSLTLSTAVGVSGAEVTNSERFADTITASTEFTEANEIISPADNSPGMVKVDPAGADLVEVRVGTGGSATNVNVLAARF